MAYHDRFRRVFDERPQRSNSFDNIFDEAFSRFPRHANWGYFPADQDGQARYESGPRSGEDFRRDGEPQRSSFSTRGFPGFSSRFDSRFGPPPASMPPPWARDMRHPYEERDGYSPRSHDMPDSGGYSNNNGGPRTTQWYREDGPRSHHEQSPPQGQRQPQREKTVKIEVERPDSRGRQQPNGGPPHAEQGEPRRMYFGQQQHQQQQGGGEPDRLHPQANGGSQRPRRSHDGRPQEQPSPSAQPIPMPPPEPRPDNGIPIPMPGPGTANPEGSSKQQPPQQPVEPVLRPEASPEVKVVRRPENEVHTPDSKQQAAQPSVIQLDGNNGPPASPASTGSASPNPVPQLERRFSRQASIGEVGDKIITMLDEIEKRVEKLRETAALLEDEKRQLMDMLNTVVQNLDMLSPSGAREDIEAITSRLLTRCGAVNVSVSTPRNPVQAEALERVNERVDAVLRLMREDIVRAEDICRRYLNASSPDQPDGPIDSRFQSMLIECTADDQKRVRKRLAQILDLMKADQPVNE